MNSTKKGTFYFSVEKLPLIYLQILSVYYKTEKFINFNQSSEFYTDEFLSSEQFKCPNIFKP